eukprot:scaffold126325_cov20-Tisochrysis_lutea.AAC.1
MHARIYEPNTRHAGTLFACVLQGDSAQLLSTKMDLGDRAKLLGAKMDLMLLAVLASGNDYLPPLRGAGGVHHHHHHKMKYWNRTGLTSCSLLGAGAARSVWGPVALLLVPAQIDQPGWLACFGYVWVAMWEQETGINEMEKEA